MMVPPPHSALGIESANTVESARRTEEGEGMSSAEQSTDIAVVGSNSVLLNSDVDVVVLSQ